MVRAASVLNSDSQFTIYQFHFTILRMSDTEIAYNSALDYLYFFVDYSLKYSSELAKADFNLDRMRALMVEIGHPEAKYPVIHLAGTIRRVKVQCQPVAKIPKLTTFEITTALGSLYYAQQKVDAAVIEVGLGGRLDATKVIMPKVSVITSLSYDHMAVLGNTLVLIAGEKAGIIKSVVPVVSAPQK
jgi:dihydrofolate synthase/folylpolyglutamate synthase